MLQLNIIKEDPQKVIKLLKIKNFDAEDLVKEIIEIDSKRRELQKKLDDGLAESNRLAREIGKLFKTGLGDESEGLKEKSAARKKENQELSSILEETKSLMEDKLVMLPNLPHPTVPPGINEAGNEIIVSPKPKPLAKAIPTWPISSSVSCRPIETTKS